MPEATETTATAVSLAPAKPRKTAAKKAAKKVAKPAAKSSAKLTKPASDDGKLPLKAICGKLKIEPRLARRKLRAAKLPFHDHRDRWNFTPKQAKQIEELLGA